jgi:hypothetical protein
MKIMMKWSTKLCVTVLLGSLILVFPAMAAIDTISQGNTVFLGEDGLNISGALGADSQIGWWASGAAIATSSPDDTYPITAATKLSVSPARFGSRLGTWYRVDASGKANGTAFVVADPYLNIRVEDKTVNVDVTQNKWVYRGDEIGFRIETNLNAIAQRPGAPGALITIKVQAPDYGVYSALVNGGTTTRIEDIQVASNPYDTGAIWDTENSVYAPGAYTIWAECNVNRMKDNYDVTGKTVSTQTSMQNTEFNPLISVSVPTTNPTTQVTQTPTKIVTTIAKTSQTTAIVTTTPIANATTIPQTSTTTLPAPVGTTTKKSPGFGIVLTVIAVAGIALVTLKKQKYS